MVKRKRAKTKPKKTIRKPSRRKVVRKKTARRKTAKRKSTRKTVRTATREAIDTPFEIAEKNRAALWAVYRDLQRKADMAWTKLRTDVQRKASPEVLLEDRNNLLLLLGECNYLAGECMRMGKF